MLASEKQYLLVCSCLAAAGDLLLYCDRLCLKGTIVLMAPRPLFYLDRVLDRVLNSS